MTANYWERQLASLNRPQVQALAAAGLLRDLITGERLDLHVRAALGLGPTPNAAPASPASFGAEP